MNKNMKKGLIVGGAIIAVILAIMIIVPFLFKGKIKEAVIGMANESLNANVIIDDFGLNLFSNFPNATLSVKEVAVVGVNEFKLDTLLNAKTASVTIDLFSLFGDNYKIKKIILDETSIYAKIAPSGAANWDIVKVDSTDVAGKTDEDSAFNLNLKDIVIKKSNITYDDQESNIKAYIHGWNGNIGGDFSASETTLRTKSVIDEFTIMMDGIPYLSKVKTTIDAELNANFDEMKFTFINSNCFLNDLAASVDGFFKYVQEGEFEFDLKLKTPGADFKQVLSLVPAMYTDDFKNIKTSGEVALNAYIVGELNTVEEIYPAFNLRLEVSNAMFQYPALPRSVDNINLLLSINGEGGSLDNVMVLADRFGFTIGGNPFKGSFRMTPAVKDKSIKFNAEGKLDLAMIKEVYPLEGVTELNGQLDANIRVATTMSAIEKEQYENASADGHITLKNLVYKSEGMPTVNINTAGLDFTPRYANLSSFDVAFGQSNLKATGRLENFIGYVLKDQTLRGQLNLTSTKLDLDELMGESDNGEEKKEETDKRGEDVMIPKNIDFILNAALTHVIFNKIDIANISGAIAVKDGILSMNNLKASALEGLANINGTYDTSDGKMAKVNFDLGLTRVSFAKTFKHIEAVQKFAPIFEDVMGTYSMNLKFDTKLGATMSETLRGLTGEGALQTSDVSLEGNKALTALGAALKTDKLNAISPKDLNLPFSIKDGAITTKPFNLNIGDGGEMMLEGVTRLDQTIDYKGTIKLPSSLENKVINKVPITIGGSFSNPKIGVDVKSAVADAVGSIVGGLLGKGKEGEDGESVDLSAKLSEEKAKQIEKLRTEADNAATKLVETAQKLAYEGVAKAGSNAFAKIAAQKLGEEAVKKAGKEAQNLRDKAEEQIKKLEGEKTVEAAETPAK